MRDYTRLLAIGALLALLALPAYGYLDPVSGSLILQAIIGGIAGAAVLIKLYWHKLLALMGIKEPEDDDDQAAD